MPELPEVESIKLQLQSFLIGHKIIDIKVNWPRIFEGENKVILNQRMVDVRRFGKVLVIDFENKYSLVIQIKLTGQLIYKGPNLTSKSNLISTKVIGGVPGKHTHVIFKLDRSGVLYYNDVRKFGRMRIVKNISSIDDNFIKNMGPEPPVVKGRIKENILNLDDFRNILSKTSIPVKLILMDQTKISGVGNIYANDALWLAKIAPQRRSKSLSVKETERLYKCIINVLKEGIKTGGASELAFVTPDGKEGNYQNFTYVYGREGKPCKKCAAEIKKVKLGGRGTYFCPVCQK